MFSGFGMMEGMRKALAKNSITVIVTWIVILVAITLFLDKHFINAILFGTFGYLIFGFAVTAGSIAIGIFAGFLLPRIIRVKEMEICVLAVSLLLVFFVWRESYQAANTPGLFHQDDAGIIAASSCVTAVLILWGSVFIGYRIYRAFNKKT
jgi:hypothetical protein